MSHAVERPSHPTEYTSKVSIPLPSDDEVRKVMGDAYDPAKTLNVIKMFAGTDDMYAATIGLVNAEVLAKAREIALELANGPTWAIRWTKLSINQILKDRVNMMLEASMALEQVTFATADHKEATLSFKEKRKPKFGKA